MPGRVDVKAESRRSLRYSQLSAEPGAFSSFVSLPGKRKSGKYYGMGLHVPV